MKQLRDYQIECRDSVVKEWETNQATLAVMATGLGKTVMFADLIKQRNPKRTLMVAHREELIWQAKNKINEWSELDCEVEMADYEAIRHPVYRRPVVLATVQTLISGKTTKRMGRFKPEEFDTLIIDECHHSTASSYRKIVDYFKQNPNLKILGVTATPERADEEALGQIFGSVAFQYGIKDGIDNGWLVDITQQFVEVKSLDFSHVRTTAGDLNGADLAAVMEAEANVQGICQPILEVLFALKPKTLDTIPATQWTEYLAGLNKKPRRSIVFTASVAQAEMCCNILNRAVPDMAEWVCGKTNKEKRREILERFSTGVTAVVVNCGVLTEGFDNPAVECIFMARPTKSLSLYTQMVGRSTRPLPGVVDPYPTKEERKDAISKSQKPYCRIIDFVGNSGRHKLINSFDVLGGKVSEKVIERSILKALEDGKVHMVSVMMTNQEIELEEEKKRKAEAARQQEEARKRRLMARSDCDWYDVDPFSRKTGPVANQKWFWQRPISERQREVLQKRGWDPDKMSPAQARTLIGEIAKKEGWYNK